MGDVTEVAEALEDQMAREDAAVEAVEAAGPPDDVSDAKGHARREALRKKAAKLIAQADELLGQVSVETGDPAKLKPDREVRQHFDEFNEVYISNADPNYKYAFVYRDPHNDFGGRFVRRLQALGWELVSGTMEEAKEHRHVDGTRVVADCVLMRCRVDRYLVLQKRDRLLRQAQQEGVSANVYDLAERAGVRVWDETPDFVRDEIQSHANSRRARALGRFHAMNANGRVDRMLRTGGIPGLPPAGRPVASPGR